MGEGSPQDRIVIEKRKVLKIAEVRLAGYTVNDKKKMSPSFEVSKCTSLFSQYARFS